MGGDLSGKFETVGFAAAELGLEFEGREGCYRVDNHGQMDTFVALRSSEGELWTCMLLSEDEVWWN